MNVNERHGSAPGDDAGTDGESNGAAPLADTTFEQTGAGGVAAGPAAPSVGIVIAQNLVEDDNEPMVDNTGSPDSYAGAGAEDVDRDTTDTIRKLETPPA